MFLLQHLLQARSMNAGIHGRTSHRLQDKTSTFKGPLDVVKHIVRKDGLLGLYAGMESTFWRCVLFPSLAA